MFKIIRSAWKLVVVGITVFVILAAVGVFIALDTASNPSVADATSVPAESGKAADNPAKPSSAGGLNMPGSLAVGLSEEQTYESEDGSGSVAPQSGGQTPTGTPQGSNTPAGSPSSSAPSNGGGSGGSTGGTDTSSQTAPPKVWHEPVYTTIHHDAIYQSVHHDAEYTTHTEYYSVCSQCGYKVQGSIYPHQDATGHTGFSSDVPISEQVLIRAAYDEQVLVQAAFDEQVLVTPGYWS